MLKSNTWFKANFVSHIVDVSCEQQFWILFHAVCCCGPLASGFLGHNLKYFIAFETFTFLDIFCEICNINDNYDGRNLLQILLWSLNVIKENLSKICSLFSIDAKFLKVHVLCLGNIIYLHVMSSHLRMCDIRRQELFWYTPPQPFHCPIYGRCFAL